MSLIPTHTTETGDIGKGNSIYKLQIPRPLNEILRGGPVDNVLIIFISNLDGPGFDGFNYLLNQFSLNHFDSLPILNHLIYFIHQPDF